MPYDTQYPTNVPDYTDLPDYQDSIDDVKALVVNDPKKELLACLIELGTLPKGSAADLSARLAVSLNNDGSLKDTLEPTFASLTLTGGLSVSGNLQIQGVYDLIFKGAGTIEHESDIDHFVETFGNDADTGWFWDDSGDLLYKKDNVIKLRIGTKIFLMGAYQIALGSGILIGAEAWNNAIDDTTHGDGSTVLYIGNKMIAVSGGVTGGAGSAGAGNQYVELKIGGTTYKVLHDGTV